MSTDWTVPDWPAPATVRAVCTTRGASRVSGTAGTDGSSRAPYDSLNLGDHVGDDARAVQANRRALAARLGVRPVFLQQVHGTRVLALSPQTPDGAQADGCLTTQRGVACTIMVADCLPVLFADLQGRTVAAAHAGWRGLAGMDAPGGQGVLEATLNAFSAASGVGPSDTLAWLGPCIGPGAFEVGPEVKAAFEVHDARATGMFRPHPGADAGRAGKWLADLPGLARQRLQALGVTQVYGNDGSAPWCTVSNPSRFFSHRRDRVSGRFAACIWLA